MELVLKDLRSHADAVEDGSAWEYAGNVPVIVIMLGRIRASTLYMSLTAEGAAAEVEAGSVIGGHAVMVAAAAAATGAAGSDIGGEVTEAPGCRCSCCCRLAASPDDRVEASPDGAVAAMHGGEGVNEMGVMVISTPSVWPRMPNSKINVPAASLMQHVFLELYEDMGSNPPFSPPPGRIRDAGMAEFPAASAAAAAATGVRGVRMASMSSRMLQ